MGLKNPAPICKCITFTRLKFFKIKIQTMRYRLPNAHGRAAHWLWELFKGEKKGQNVAQHQSKKKKIQSKNKKIQPKKKQIQSKKKKNQSKNKQTRRRSISVIRLIR